MVDSVPDKYAEAEKNATEAGAINDILGR